MPPKSDSLQLHMRLLAGDPTVSAQLAEIHLPSLITRLSSEFPATADHHFIEMAVHDAIMDYLSHPERYDPAKLPLDAYLRMSARGDLKNHLRRHKASDGSSRFGEIVELDAVGMEQGVEDVVAPSIDEVLLDRDSPVWDRLSELLSDPVDQEIVLLMMDNVRNTEDYVAVLGIWYLPPDEQAREVKRNKDRLKKRLQRHLQRSEIEQND